jgi:putative tricarboxylic transport membrane protein
MVFRDFFKHKDRIGSLLLFVFAVVFMQMSYTLDIGSNSSQAFNARTLPLSLSVLLAICSLIHLLRPTDTPIDDDAAQWKWKQVGALIVLMAAYALSFPFLGFMLCSIAFLVLGFRVLGERSYQRSLFIAGTLVGAIWLLLTQVFGLFLDHGELTLSLLKFVGD